MVSCAIDGFERADINLRTDVKKRRWFKDEKI